MKTIVISAVNLNVGGTLTILRDCLSYLSSLEESKEYRIIAIVYKKELADFPNIEYIETQWPKKRWVNRLWFEYVSMNKISKKIGSIHLWLSLHDTTPNVAAERRAVYCHNPFPFYQWKWQEFVFAPKIVLFALFSKLIYKKNIHQNNTVIVQQQWIKNAFKHLFSLSKDKVVIAIPEAPSSGKLLNGIAQRHGKKYTFIYPASPNSHKNFESLCKASSILEEDGIVNFKVYVTITGNENRYANWLFKKWGKLKSVQWIGFQSRQSLFTYYKQSDCLIFPSKVETWGLPISEFSNLERPMLLADLPYTHETAAGIKQVAFFDPDRPEVLAEQMKRLIQGDDSFLQAVPKTQLEEPVANSWDELFQILLQP